MTSTEYRLPNRGEVADLLLPTVRRLCREQTFVFVPKMRGKHPRIINTDTGESTSLPTTLFDGPVRYKYEANLRRIGADLSFPRAERETVSGPSFSDDMGQQTVDYPWTEAEWRAMQAESDTWWRRLYAPELYPEPEPEPEEAPEPSPHLTAMVERITRSRTRDDAKGPGPLSEARQMVRDGYSVDRVVQRTGWGAMWLADLVNRAAAD